MSENDGGATRTPLSEAARVGDTKKLSELVQNGCDINRRQWSETLLHFVCKRAPLETAQFIIENGGKSQLFVENDMQWTPIYEALYWSRIDLFDLFVANGASLRNTNEKKSMYGTAERNIRSDHPDRNRVLEMIRAANAENE